MKKRAYNFKIILLSAICIIFCMILIALTSLVIMLIINWILICLGLCTVSYTKVLLIVVCFSFIVASVKNIVEDMDRRFKK